MYESAFSKKIESMQYNFFVENIISKSMHFDNYQIFERDFQGFYGNWILWKLAG